MAREPQPDHPASERPQEFGVTEQKRPEIYGGRPRHEESEDVLTAVVCDADRQLVWEVPDARFDAVAEGKMGHVHLSKSGLEEPGHYALGERHLRRTLREFAARYHRERITRASQTH
jgi:hypothetical protein